MLGFHIKKNIKRLKLSYIIIFISLVSWSFFAYFTMTNIISSQKSYSKLINISGKQRMLSQKTTLLTHKVVETNDQIYLNQLKNTKTLMETDHNYLLKNLTSPHMKSIYFNTPYNLNKNVNDYFKLLDDFIAKPNLEKIKTIENYSENLLPKLNYSVYEFEKESDQKIQDLYTRESYILIGTLLTLILEIFLIVIPTLKTVNKAEETINNFNDELKEQVKQKEKELSNQYNLRKTYLDTMNSILVILDENANIIDINKYGLKILGYTHNELVGKNWFEIELIEKIEIKKVKKYFDKIISGKNELSNISFENKLITKNGERLLLTWSNSLIEENDKIIGVVSAGIDITNERKQENILNEQEKLASMGEMIGNIAHQWRQPLSIITTSASSSQIEKEMGTITDEKYNMYMETIISQAEYLSKTIDTFRDYIKEKKELKEVVLQDRINKALKIVDASLKNHYIKLKSNLKELEDIKIKITVGELSQVIINILNNSKDALVEQNIKDPWIEIQVAKKEKEVIISIEDNANGIPNDILPHIFEPYFTTKHKSKGTGLGLHMSYKIITESLNGQIYAKNTTNGAIFFIKLPLD